MEGGCFPFDNKLREGRLVAAVLKVYKESVDLTLLKHNRIDTSPSSAV